MRSGLRACWPAGLLAGSLSASAQESTSGQSDGSASTATVQPGDPPPPPRGDEELLTGSTAEKVEAAALAEYPGATVVRVETDGDGLYEAQLVKADGEPVTVEVNADFEVTGTEDRGGPPGPCGPDGSAAGAASST
jgi:hypothetical protein